MILTGENLRIWRRPCPGATLSTINPIWTAYAMKPCLYSEKLVTNCLSYGTAHELSYFCMYPASTGDPCLM